MCHSRRASRQPARRKAEGVGPLLSIPGVLLFSARSGTVGNITPETATEQNILKVAGRSSQQQQSFQPRPPPEQLPRGKETAHGSLFPAAPRPAFQRLRGRRAAPVRGRRLFGAHSETKSKQIKTQTYVCPAVVQQLWQSAAAAGAPPLPLPQGRQARRKAEGVGPLFSMPVVFCPARSGTVSNITSEAATEQSILEVASRSSQSQQQQQSFQPSLRPSRLGAAAKGG